MTLRYNTKTKFSQMIFKYLKIVVDCEHMVLHEDLNFLLHHHAMSVIHELLVHGVLQHFLPVIFNIIDQISLMMFLRDANYDMVPS